VGATDAGPGPSLLGIYLNDHLAGATAGAELARRMASSGHLPDPQGALPRLASEITEDRAALLAMMAALDLRVRSYKIYAAWIGEKAGRLKPNGHLRTRSQLSNLEELELLRLGVEGKAAGWRTLRVAADSDRRLAAGRLDDLITRARGQADLLEDLRVRAAAEVIAADPVPGRRREIRG
jgi:hypothetical protein